MSPDDRTFLVALAAVLILMLALVVAPESPGGGGTASGLSGEPRRVDVDLLRRRIIRGELSEKEAMYYHREGEFEGR